MTATECTEDGLAHALTRVASDPGQACHLHEVFGGFCHQFRNLLNSMKMSFYLARRCGDQAWDESGSILEARYEHVERFIDRFQQVCRPMSINPIRISLGCLFDDRRGSWSTRLAGRGRCLVVEPPSVPVVGVFDPMRLGSGLDDLVAWRAEAGDPATDLRVRWSARGGEFQVEWDEPAAPTRAGPGPSAGETTLHLGREGSGAEFLEALALPLLARIMTSHGGRLVGSGPNDPWCLTLRWPLDAQPPLSEAPSCSA